MIAEHAALPFGSEASVHGWDRIGTEASFRVSCPHCIKCCMAGALLRKLARRLLHIPALRYVDDFFGVDRESCIEHTMQCVARSAVRAPLACHIPLPPFNCRRLVRACLGPDAVSAKKLLSGSPLEILGVDTCFTREGISLVPSQDKIKKWLARLEAHLHGLP